jgi:ATP-binding cassette subfamily C (CFTR/MRP) protein 1
LSFITYSLAGNELDTATIFASLQLFNMMEVPMSVLPTVFSFLSDGHVAVGRIAKILKADEQSHEIAVHTEQELAIDADGDFEFETADTKIDDVQGWTHIAQRPAPLAEGDPETDRSESMISAEKQEPSKNFALRDIVLRIPRGAFVCIVGRIGSGKSALLQGLLGEMKQTRGNITFGADISLATQIPWIQSASVKENIIFGQRYDEGRLEQVVRACALEPDLRIFSDGLSTEIGGESNCRVRRVSVTERLHRLRTRSQFERRSAKQDIISTCRVLGRRDTALR